MRACNFVKKKLQHRCFRVKFAKFLRVPILKKICERLLLFFQYNSHHFHYHHLHYHRKMQLYQGRIQRFWKGVALYVGHHGWPTKKILRFRWSKKTNITLETISFEQNISISIFKFSPFYIQWKFANEILSIFENLQMLW